MPLISYPSAKRKSKQSRFNILLDIHSFDATICARVTASALLHSSVACRREHVAVDPMCSPTPVSSSGFLPDLQRRSPSEILRLLVWTSLSFL